MKVNVCVVTFPLDRAGVTPLSNLAELLSRLADRVYIVSSSLALENLKSDGKIQKMEVVHKVDSRILMRVINYVRTQLRILSYVVMISGKVNLFVFFIGGEGLLVPMIALKLRGKKVALMPGGNTARIYLIKRDPFFKIINVLAKIGWMISDCIVVRSDNQVHEMAIKRYRDKILKAHEYFIDFRKLRIARPFDTRGNLVGYVGRFSAEKGIMNFVRAIPKVLKMRKDIRFLIIGDGPLFREVEEYLAKKALSDKAGVMGWVSHEELPKFLNELRLLVVPSYTESGPLIALEAMACGTPVLSSFVGIMTNVINDGKNGFLMEGNYPETIAKSLLKILEREDLDRISMAARKVVETGFTFDVALKAWKGNIEAGRIRFG